MKANMSTHQWPLSALVFFLLFSGRLLLAQTSYTYTAESFEDTVWSAAPSSSTPINSATGTWTVATNNVRSQAVPAQHGAYSLLLQTKTNALVSPRLGNGAGVLTYYVVKTGSRTIWAQTSKDKITWSSAVDSFVVTSTWTMRRVLINDTTVRYIRFTANSNSGVYIDNVLITSPGAPGVSVITTPPASITQTTALSGGTVVSNGSATILSRGVCFNKTGFADTSSDKIVATGTTGPFISEMINLTAGTTYYLKAYAVTNMGVNYGVELSFTTLPADAPIAYWTQGFNDTTQMPTSNPLTPLSITVPNQGTWVYLKAFRATNPAYIRDSSRSDLRLLKNGSYVITPVLDDGVTELSYLEGRGERVLSIYTSTDSGTMWTLLQTDTTSRAAPNIVRVNSPTVNRLKIANESGGDADIDNLTVTVFPSGIPPVVTTSAVSNIGKNTASSGGEVTSGGTKPVVVRGVCWSVHPFPLIADHTTQDGSGTGVFHSSLAGLPAGTLIYMKAYATSRSGTGYGNEITFTTQAATIPVVTTSAITQVTGETAQCGGNITDGGGAPITQRGVCWNTQGNPTTQNDRTKDSTGSGVYQSLLINLTPGTKYYCRAYAISIAGTGYGAVDSFSTGSVHMPAVTTSDITGILSYKATGGGNVTDDGNAPIVRGLCFNKTGSPTIADNKIISGSGSGAFTCLIGNLSGSTLYYVRAFVTNSAGTAYGAEVTFTTSASTAFYISPTGNDITGDGSKNNPFFSVQKAIDLVVPGDTIFMRGGTYPYSRRINITRGGAPYGGTIVLRSIRGERALLDFSSMAVADSNQGIRITASYWHFYELDIKGAGDNGMLIERNKPSGGSYIHVRDLTDQAHDNIVENCSFFENRDTGLQLKNLAENNRVINCDSYFNRDPNDGNADGFAPKLTVGTGNYFYGCRAWQNSDDGWDGLLTTADNGFPDDMTTTIENCWAFMNGYLKNGTPSQGNGNGFKLGGAGSNDERHNMILRRCVAVDNLQKGFDQNHNEGNMTLINCSGFSKPLPGNSSHYTFRIDGTILAPGKQLIHINNVAVSDGLPSGSSQFAPCQMIGGTKTTCDYLTLPADFVTTDTTGLRGQRKPDGSLPDLAFMHIKPGNTKLIDAGTIVAGMPFLGTAPDLGAFEFGTPTWIPENDKTGLAPAEFSLGQNYPNPFNPTTTIDFTLAKDGWTTLKIYDVLGCEVASLINGDLKAGVYHSVKFNAATLPSGIYFSCLESVGNRQIRKIMLLK